jgi:hypothetical protein
MFRANATTRARPAGELHFEVHRTALAEAGADAAWAAAWLLLWLVFLLALAPPSAAFGGLAGPDGAPAACSTSPTEPQGCRAATGNSAQPDPGPSSRGVASVDRGGAG